MATAVERAYEWLREGIVQGTLPAGSFVEESTVCEAAGVSRTPVREAFHRLAGERYLTLTPRRGAQVRELGAKEMYEVFSARYAIESFAVQELCQKRAGVPADMAQALDEMTAFEEFSKPDIRYGRLDIRFHRAYVAATENAVLLSLYDSLRPLHERSSMMQAQVAVDDIRAVTTRQHIELLEALAAHDADRALEVLRLHLSPWPEVRMYLPG